MIMFGNGTPAGTLAPWTTAPLGSLWLSTNQSANTVSAWVKVQDNDAVADWVAFEMGTTRFYETGEFDMDATANQYDYWYCPRALNLLAAYLVYVEATDSTGAAEGNISAGTAADGTQFVAATAYEPSKTVGYAKTLTLASSGVSAGGKVVTKNTKVTATEAGQFKVMYLYAEQ
jgi:hypothetical protein